MEINKHQDDSTKQSESDVSRILVLNEDKSELDQVCNALRSQLQNTCISPVNSLDDYKLAIGKQVFDLVILDHEFGNTIELIQELKWKENEPALLVVSNSTDPRLFAEMSNLRCHRYILKDDSWFLDIGTEARRAMRLKRLEEENRELLTRLTEANALLEERNKKLDEFSVVVAHDIRGVLSGISMRLECVLDTEFQGDARSKKLLDGAFRAARHAIDMVQEAYNYARLGAQASKMESVDLRVLVDEVVNDLCLSDEKSVSVSISDLPFVWGNEPLLRRVFINLIGNAVKYNSREMKSVNIGIRSYLKSGVAEYCLVYVKDNGDGISEDEIPNLFKMFARGTTNTANKEGVGVGLSVVKKIIDIHMGDISVESTIGAGTTFLIKLPLRKIEFA